MTDPITLYDSPGSPCARRVRAVLLEKGLAWTTRLVDLTRMEQKRPEYLALNPNGVVPTLVHGDRVLYESNVITEYLDDVFPDPPLYPRDPWARAQAKIWQAFELAMARDFRPLMYARVIGPYDRLRPRDEVLADARRSTDDPAHLDWVRRVYDGEVVSVIGAGAFVAFGEDAYEGLLPVRRLRGDWWELNEEGTILHGERSGATIRLGDPVRVRVDRVDTPRGRVDLLPADTFEV